MNYSAIILCAGKGSRTGLNYNKMFYQIDKQTVYEKIMKIFLDDKTCKEIIVVCKEEEKSQFQAYFHDNRIIYTNGGKERQDSVYEGLKHVHQGYVMIHDGARCFLTNDLLIRIKETLKKHSATLLAVPTIDTIKQVIDGKVVKTLVRSELYQAQTPQAFKTNLIKQAYIYCKNNHIDVTDDASCVEAYGEDVYITLSDYTNKKITTPQDL